VKTKKQKTLTDFIPEPNVIDIHKKYSKNKIISLLNKTAAVNTEKNLELHRTIFMPSNKAKAKKLDDLLNKFNL